MTLLFAAITIALPAQIIELTKIDNEGSLSIIAVLSGLDKQTLMQSIADGHRTVIAYQIKVFRKNTGFWRILGDRLTGETTIRYKAWYDAFTRTYVIEEREGPRGGQRGGQRGAQPSVGDDERQKTFRDTESFLSALFTTGTRIFDNAVESDGVHYCLSRAIIAMIEFPPPLTILTPFVRDFRIETPWTRRGL